MEPVEQIILNVRQNKQSRHIDVACATEMVRTSDLAELVGWFSQDVSELIVRFDTPNLFFHPLPSGDFAVGIIFPSQTDFFSVLRQPNDFIMRVLIVPQQTLRQWGNNPIALYRHFEQRGRLPFFTRPPKRIRSLTPKLTPSSSSPRNQIHRLVEKFGPHGIAMVIQSLQDAVCTFFSSSIYSVDVIDALFEIFPVPWRTELTFASELFFSLKTPLRFVGVAGERRIVSERARSLGVPLIRLDDFAVESVPSYRSVPETWHPWTRFVFHCLRTGDVDILLTQLNTELNRDRSFEAEEEISVGNFDALQRIASRYLWNIEAESQRTPTNPLPIQDDEIWNAIPLISLKPSIGADVFGSNATALKESPSRSPRLRIAQNQPLLELLVSVDSSMARALFGDTSALPTLKSAWDALRAQLGWEDREQLREEFLALVHSVATEERNPADVRSPRRNVGILDVLLIFLDN